MPTKREIREARQTVSIHMAHGGGPAEVGSATASAMALLARLGAAPVVPSSLAEEVAELKQKIANIEKQLGSGVSTGGLRLNFFREDCHGNRAASPGEVGDEEM
jgi:L-serine deaminase